MRFTLKERSGTFKVYKLIEDGKEKYSITFANDSNDKVRINNLEDKTTVVLSKEALRAFMTFDELEDYQGEKK